MPEALRQWESIERQSRPYCRAGDHARYRMILPQMRRGVTLSDGLSITLCKRGFVGWIAYMVALLQIDDISHEIGVDKFTRRC